MGSESAGGGSPLETMFSMITGYWVSQAVGAAADLGLPDHVADQPRSARDLAARVGCDADALARLLRACAAVGIFRVEGDGRFGLAPLGRTLCSNVPGSMRALAIAQTAPGHWLPWGRLRDAVRTGQRQTLSALGQEIFEYYSRTPEEAAAFSSAMQNLSALVALEVARVVDLSSVRRAVDVGGGEGFLVAELVAANPSLHGVVLDLPHETARAQGVVQARGLADRIEVVAGDFFQAVPPADVYLLKQILHDWNDDQCRVILRHCARGLGPGGCLLIVEMVIPDDGGPTLAQLVDLDMLVMLPGRERTRREYADLLSSAGLRLARMIETSSPFQIIEARSDAAMPRR
jgi:SAM-dependent methyltransferase